MEKTEDSSAVGVKKAQEQTSAPQEESTREPRVAALHRKLADLQLQLAEAHRSLATQHQEREEEADAFGDMVGRITRMEASLREANTKLAGAESRCADAVAGQESGQAERTRLSEELAAAVRRETALRARSEELQRELTDASAELLEARSSVVEVARRDREIAGLREAIAVAEARCRDHEATIARLSEEDRVAQDKLAASSADLSEARAEVRKLRSELAALPGARAALMRIIASVHEVETKLHAVSEQARAATDAILTGSRPVSAVPGQLGAPTLQPSRESQVPLLRPASDAPEIMIDGINLITSS